jgi:hypothetical protein
VSERGPNAHGETVDPGQVTDLLPRPPAGRRRQGWAGKGLVVAPRGLLHPAIPQPAESLLCELATGHSDRAPASWSSPPTWPRELRAWLPDTSAPLAAELAPAAAVVWCWRPGDLLGLDSPSNRGRTRGRSPVLR